MKPHEAMIFDLAGRVLAVDLARVEEVVQASTVTALPKAPPFLLGVAAVRGRILGVIDAAKRYGVGPALSGYYMVCKVRETVAAVAIDRPLNAGTLMVEDLPPEEAEAVIQATGIPRKFLKGAFEIFEGSAKNGWERTGVKAVSIDADLFISDEMAVRLAGA